MSQSQTLPTHLDPSELGNKEYWDKYYQNDLDNEEDEEGLSTAPLELESWFDDVGAPTKTLDFLTSESFPLSPNFPGNLERLPSVLDLGTGNGSALFSLRIEGGYRGPMVGLDYSQQSVDLAIKLSKKYLEWNCKGIPKYSHTAGAASDDIIFHVVDLIHDDPTAEDWWPRGAGGFDLVLDKGTFDAISLSSDTIRDCYGNEKRICEVYPRQATSFVAPGGFLLITSCNWTEAEVIRWFTAADGDEDILEVFGAVKYPTYEFGGLKGQGIASVCFRRLSRLK